MNPIFSPGSIITISGSLLSVIGLMAYFFNATNLSVPTFFYGVPILLIGLSLKTVELPPAKIISNSIKKLKDPDEIELKKVVKDVSGWKYGPAAHLESSLKVLKLWDIDNPPKLQEVEELNINEGYGIRLRFEIGNVSFDKWEEKQERLGRFFAKNLTADLLSHKNGYLDLILKPSKGTEDKDDTTNT